MIMGDGFINIFNKFMEDDETKAIVMLGGQSWPYEAASIEYYGALSKKKPLIGFVADHIEPFKYNLGYASDIMANRSINPEEKRRFMLDAGMIVIDNINHLHNELENLFGKK